MRSLCLTFAALATILSVAACSDSRSEPSGPVAISDRDSRLLIRDVTGKEWDVAHARSRYGMQPSQFQYGLGPQAIRPILQPHMLLPGEEGYPEADGRFLVIGVDLFNSLRSYPIQVMGWHEVANERFGKAHVAVAY
jgi:hypothetical protein